MKRASAAEWAKRVEDWKDSGLTAKEFAAETGLKASTLAYWKSKLQAAGDESDRGDKRAGRTKKRQQPIGPNGSAPSPLFIELPRVAVASQPAMLELVLARDLSVRVPAGFDEDTLTRVVRAVGAMR